MAYVPVGRMIVWGADGVISWTGMVAASEQFIQTLTNRQSFNVQELKVNGKVMAAAADEPVEEITVVVTPAAGDGEGENTLANAQAAVHRPTPLQKVTIESDIAVFDGDFNYMGGDVALSDGAVQHTMNLKSWNGAPLNPPA